METRRSNRYAGGNNSPYWRQPPLLFDFFFPYQSTGGKMSHFWRLFFFLVLLSDVGDGSAIYRLPPQLDWGRMCATFKCMNDVVRCFWEAIERMGRLTGGHDGEGGAPEGGRVAAPLRRRSDFGGDFEREGLLAHFHLGEGVGVQTEGKAPDLLLWRHSSQTATTKFRLIRRNYHRRHFIASAKPSVVIVSPRCIHELRFPQQTFH